MYENSELNDFKNIKFLGEISSYLPNDLLGIRIYTRFLINVDNRY